MADPRLIPIDNLPINDYGAGRLQVPAGLEGLQVMAAQGAYELGGQTLTGDIDPQLGQIAGAIRDGAGIVGTLNNFAKNADSYLTQQNMQKLQQEFNGKLNQLNGSMTQFNDANTNFNLAGAQLANLQAIGQTYVNGANQLMGETAQYKSTLDALSVRSTELMTQFRSTRDSATRAKISSELKSIQSQVLQAQNEMQVANAKLVQLKDAMKGLQTEIDGASAELATMRDNVVAARDQLMKNYGEVNQTKESMINDLNNWMTRSDIYGTTGMSADALGTFSKGLNDFAMGNYAKSGFEFGAMAFDYTDMFAPGLGPTAGVLKGMMFGLGEGVESGNFMLGANEFLRALKIGSSIDGTMRAWGSLENSLNGNDPVAAYASLNGLLGNSFDVMARGAQIGMGLTPAAPLVPLVNTGSNLLTDLMFWQGALINNVTATGDIAPTAAATMELMNFMNVLDVTDGNMVVGTIGDLISSIENLFDGKLGDKGNLSAGEKARQTLEQMQRDYNNGRLDFGQAAYQKALGAMWTAQEIPNTFDDQVTMMTKFSELVNTRLFDGINAPFQNYPWSEAPTQPYDPFTGQQQFIPDYSKMQPWDPTDPFNLDPDKKPQKKEEPKEPPDCPKEPPPKPPTPPVPPPQPPTSGKGTGELPDEIPMFEFKLPDDHPSKQGGQISGGQYM